MFNWYNTIKQYYTLGLYNEIELSIFVNAGWITAEQKDEIITSTTDK